MKFGKRAAWWAVMLCALIVVFAWWTLLAHSRGVLTVSFLDIGQGDSIYIESPTGRQVLIDGGRPDRAVLRELGEVMSWSDRTIDLIIPTHPDLDHAGGLLDVFERFEVGHVLESSVEGDTDQWRALEEAIRKEGSTTITASRGQIVDIGGGAYLEILFPDRDVSHIETNTGSVVAQLVYGETSFMLTGDSPVAIEKYLIALGGPSLKSSVLKAGHHGSRTSSSPEFLDAVDPEYVVFSRGCDNTYGHPHPEVVGAIQERGIKILDTCTEGRATLTSDGTRVEMRTEQ